MERSKSKRRQSTALLESNGERKSKKSKKAPDLMEQKILNCIQTAGLHFGDGDAPNDLNVSKASFQKKLCTILKQHPGDLLENVDTFLQELGEYLEEPKRFNQSLMPCMMSSGGDSSAAVSDSAIRLLLGADVIQSPLMGLLLGKLLTFWGEEDDYIFHQGQMVYIPRLLLSQFRFLDCIVDGKELTSKLLNTLSNTSLEVQKEILACLPDIVEDSEHGEVALKLRGELTSNKDLTCAVIDALTYLNISEEQVIKIRSTILDMLKTFSINDLPIVVNFLLESLNAQDALEVVNEIRLNIDFVTSSKISVEEREKVNTSTKLTVDALKGRLQFQRFVAEAWIKALDTAQTAQTLDVYVLLILHWLNHRKAVESLMRNKIRARLLTENTLTKVFSAHSQIVRDYFPSILSLAQTLVRSTESRISHIGSIFYTLSFCHFDSYCKQEIVASLLSHIGSGLTSEIDTALDILADLVKSQQKEMTRYAIFIKGALDYLDHNNLSITHIKKLYLLLAQLAFKASQHGHYLQDDLHIIIRKQLTSGNSKYKRMGVMGAVSIVQALAGCSGKNQKQLDKESYKQVVNLLELMKTSCHRDAEVTALFLDSLAAILNTQRLADNVEAWIADNMTEAFEVTYVADEEDLEDLKKKSSIPIERLYNLNDEAESTIFLKLVPLVEKAAEKKLSFDATSNPLCLAPLFRLITKCEMLRNNGDLENIDALLGCPLLMISPDIASSMPNMPAKEKDLVCASLFFCINWIREILNSFGSMTNIDMKEKVVKRLHLITQLCDQLKCCLAHHPSYLPAPAIFELDTSHVKKIPIVASGDKGKGGKQKKGKGKGKKKGSKTNDETLVNSTQDVDRDTSEEGGPNKSTMTQSSMDASCSVAKKATYTSSTVSIDLSGYRQFFRELDISVFPILKVGMTQRFSSQESIVARAEALDGKGKACLDLPELKYLLEDLATKLRHAFTSRFSFSSSAGRPPAGGAGNLKGEDLRNAGFSNLDLLGSFAVAKHVVALFPSLCDMLEEACSFFQTGSSENDDEEETPLRSEADTTQMGVIYHLLLQCSLSLLGWQGFLQDDGQDLLGKVLEVAVGKLNPNSNKEEDNFVSREEGLRCMFKYFGNLVETVPSLDAAVTLIKLLRILTEMSMDKSSKEKLAKHAKAFLVRDWRDSDGEPLRGAHHCENLQMILRTYTAFSSNPLETLESLATQSLVSMVDKDKRGHAEDLASLNRWTVPAYFKVVLTELITNVKKIPSAKKSNSIEVLEELLLSWTVSVKILHVSVSLTKVFSGRANLACALRLGRQFIELFLHQGMPLMDITFRRRHAQVEKLLRSLQQSTRMLHHLCGHSKINKDVALTNQVPMLKKALESFVYRVKAMLALNDCQDAFWIGNLKNRNLQGEEILTQTSVASSQNSAAADSNDENDDDGNEDDVNMTARDENEDSEVELDQEDPNEPTITQEDSNADGGSYSEVF